jgi:putative oxidoreductase
MKRSVPWGALLLLVRLGLAAVFVVAGMSKLLDPSGFATNISQYQLFPELSPWLAATLPATEIVAAVALVLGRRPWRQAGALAVSGMMAIFIVAGVWALVQGIDVSCGCFGSGSASVSGWTLARNLALLAAGALVLVGDRAPAPR